MEKVTPKIEIRDGKFYLLEDFKYCFHSYSTRNGGVSSISTKYVIIPKGYETNFASIPSFARGIVSPIDPQIVVAALVHDWLVNEFDDGTEKRVIITEIIDIEPRNTTYMLDKVDWKQAAAILRNIMEEYGAPLWKKQIVYLAIRAYGVFR